MTHRMKQLLLSCAAALVLLGPVAGHAQATFQTPAVTVTTQPVARAKVMLELSGPLPAGATVSIGGVPVPVDGSITPLPDGDLAIATGAGSTTAVIELRIRSVLNDPINDLCTLKAGQTGSKAITFIPTGFPGITGYRLTGFSAASVSSCKCASRRVKALTWTTPPPGVDRGRFPMDILLVLDQSGSMASPTPGDPMLVPKWTALQSAVGQFVSLWELEGLGAGSTGGTGLTQDRLALIYFSTNPETITFGASPFIARGTGGPPHPWEALKSHVNARAPGGTTALGGGIKNALDAWTAAPRNDATFLVMTDGMQNRPPMVADGTGPNAGVKVLDLGEGTELSLRDQCVPMLTVAVGNAATPWAELMDAIAQQTAGRSRLTAGLGMPAVFNASLVDALKGSTLSLALEAQGTVSGAGAPSSNKVFLDSSVKDALVVLSWLGSPFLRRAPAVLRIHRPDGTEVAPVARVDGQTYTVQRVDLPASGPAGEWTLEVENNDVEGIIPYQLSVFTEETGLDFGLHFDSAAYAAGQPITLEASAFFEQKPLEDLGSGLTVLIERPGSPLGTLLHESEVPEGTPPPVNDNLPPYELKLNALLQDPEFLKRVGPTGGTKPVRMRHLGAGRYTVTVDDTRVPGTYRFHVLLDTRRPNGDVLRRLETVEAKAEVIPDGTSSVIQSAAAGGDSYVLTLVPRDRFGNYKGPGYDDRISVKIDGGGKVTSIGDPKADGTYQVHLSGVKDDTPITITVGNTVIAKGPVSKPMPVRGGPPNHKGRGCAHCGSSDGGLLLYLLPLLALPRRRRGQRP